MSTTSHEYKILCLMTGFLTFLRALNEKVALLKSKQIELSIRRVLLMYKKEFTRTLLLYKKRDEQSPERLCRYDLCSDYGILPENCFITKLSLITSTKVCERS